MPTFDQHKQALLCNDAQSIADYESAMAQATQAVANLAKKRQNVHRR